MNTLQNDQELLTEYNHPDEVVMEEKASSITQGGYRGFASEDLTGPKRWLR